MMKISGGILIKEEDTIFNYFIMECVTVFETMKRQMT